MFAVFSNKSIAYLGDDRVAAMSVLESKDGSTLKTVNTLANLATAFEFYLSSGAPPTSDSVANAMEAEVAALEEELSDAVESVLEQLDKAGINAANAAERLREDGQRALGEVRSLGIKGMNAVGEGFVALGELLKKADEAKEGESEDEAS